MAMSMYGTQQALLASVTLILKDPGSARHVDRVCS